MPAGACHRRLHCRQLPSGQDVPLQLGRQGAAEPAQGSLQSLQCNQSAAQFIWNQVWADTRHVEVQNGWDRALVLACQVSLLALVNNVKRLVVFAEFLYDTIALIVASFCLIA